MVSEAEQYREAIKRLRDGYADAADGLAYVRQFHGKLTGVGFDRVADNFFEHVTMPEREGFLAGSHTLPANPRPTLTDAEIIEVLARVIRECGIQFRNYEMNHLAKCTPDGDAKAFRNKQMADKCAAALRNAGLIGDGR